MATTNTIHSLQTLVDSIEGAGLHKHIQLRVPYANALLTLYDEKLTEMDKVIEKHRNQKNNTPGGVEKLLNDILEMSPIEWDNPNGPVEFSCPFCKSYVTGRLGAFVNMLDIKHDSACIFVQAKSILQNI